MWSPLADLERRVRSVAVLCACLLLCMTLALLVVGNADGFQLISNSAFARSHQSALRWVTDYGMYPFYIFFLGLLTYGWLRGRGELAKLGAAYLLAQLIGSVVIVRALKILLAQPRPDSAAALHSQGWIGPSLDSALNSFPSGHSADLFTSAVLLAVLLPRLWMRVSGLAFALFVGFTRIALAKHYPIDVLAGAFIGSAVSLAVAYCWLAPRLSARHAGDEK
jgi:undecaprenyl-diphosphatase